jgi:hypothetical protein
VTETPEERFDRLGRSERFGPKGILYAETRDFVLRNGRWVRKEEVAGGSEKKATTNGAGSDGPPGAEPPPADSPDDYGSGPDAEQDAQEQAHANGADHANFENSPDDDADDNGLCEVNIAADKTPIPPRQWLLGSVFCLGYFSSLIGEGGVGKTAVRLLQWLSVATGRNLLGDHVFKRMPVLLICLEDDYQEIRRRLKAAMLHHGIGDAEVDGWLWVACPRGVKLAELRAGSPVAGKLEKWVRKAVERRKPGLVAFDPFVKTHSLPENDNVAMDFVAGLLTSIAGEYGIAVDGPHHTKKGVVAGAGDPEVGRGAGAMKDAARLVYTLMRMTPEEAKTFCITEERRLLVRFDSAKVNLCAPSADARWFKLVGVAIGNGTDAYPNGDHVQTAEEWTPPDAWAGMTYQQINVILDDINDGLSDGRRYSNHHNADDRGVWHLIQRHLPDKTEKQARAIANVWIKHQVLIEKKYQDPTSRKERTGLYLNPDPSKRPGAKHD